MIHRNWISSHITDRINSHSQNGLEYPITCILFLPSFHEPFRITKSVCRKSEAVFKLVFGGKKKKRKKISHKYYREKKEGKEEEIPAWLSVK